MHHVASVIMEGSDLICVKINYCCHCPSIITADIPMGSKYNTGSKYSADLGMANYHTKLHHTCHKIAII